MFNKIRINFSAFGNFREMICKPAFARPFSSQKLRCNVNWTISKIIILIFQAFCFALSTCMFIVHFRLSFAYASVCFWQQRTLDRMQLVTHCSITIKVIKFNERPDEKANR